MELALREFCTIESPRVRESRREFRFGELRKNRMNAGEFRWRANELHNFRVTLLWTACTRLIKRQLRNREFD
jgi:hypothetical protein